MDRNESLPMIIKVKLDIQLLPAAIVPSAHLSESGLWKASYLYG